MSEPIPLLETTESSAYGTDIKSTLPSGKTVAVGTDFYTDGEKGKPMLQVLIYEPEQDDYAVAIRFNDDGEIVEIQLDSGARHQILIVGNEASPWIKERDGDL
jgi:hypothetical protein